MTLPLVGMCDVELIISSICLVVRYNQSMIELLLVYTGDMLVSGKV